MNSTSRRIRRKYTVALFASAIAVGRKTGPAIGGFRLQGGLAMDLLLPIGILALMIAVVSRDKVPDPVP